jgi:hypothetical protein
LFNGCKETRQGIDVNQAAKDIAEYPYFLSLIDPCAVSVGLTAIDPFAELTGFDRGRKKLREGLFGPVQQPIGIAEQCRVGTLDTEQTEQKKEG